MEVARFLSKTSFEAYIGYYSGKGVRLGSKDGNTVSGTIRSNFYINIIGLKSGGIHLQCTKSVPILLNPNTLKF